MSDTENLCKWHFDIQTGEDQGPGDALGQNFKGNYYWKNEMSLANRQAHFIVLREGSICVISSDDVISR